MSTLVLSAKEVFQLMHSQKLYFLNWENWVQWGIIVNVVMVSFHNNPLESIEKFTFLITRNGSIFQLRTGGNMIFSEFRK